THRCSWDPFSADPTKDGVGSFVGEPSTAPTMVGAAGAWLSIVTWELEQELSYPESSVAVARIWNTPAGSGPTTTPPAASSWAGVAVPTTTSQSWLPFESR